jgi:hypothetical protein
VLPHRLAWRDSVPSALDVRLGLRMLRKYPCLAIVGGIGMAVATAIGAGAFAFFNTCILSRRASQ